MSSSLTMILPLVLLVVIMYFLLIRPQKKREKQVTAMRNAVKVGDEVVTIGGIRGKIVKTKDEVLTIQVGSDKMKFDIMRWAISKVENEDGEHMTKPIDDEDEAPKKKAIPKKMTKPSDDDQEAEAQEEVAEDEAEEKSSPKPKKL